jgi:mRNA-degrading endonuclease YafQ of YafQ-DinJ toxin-antitoxin module
MNLFASEKFKRKYKKLPKAVKTKAEKQEEVFLANPFDVRLYTHKLHGKDKNHWAYSVDRRVRIKFAFLEDGTVLYLDIGTHDEVY